MPNETAEAGIRSRRMRASTCNGTEPIGPAGATARPLTRPSDTGTGPPPSSLRQAQPDSMRRRSSRSRSATRTSAPAARQTVHHGAEINRAMELAQKEPHTMKALIAIAATTARERAATLAIILTSAVALIGPAAASAADVAVKVLPSEQEIESGIRSSVEPPATASESKLGLVEARVQLWRSVQRTELRKYGTEAFDGSEYFSCSREARFRVYCSFSYETADASYCGYGRVRKFGWRRYGYWWKASPC